MGHTDDAAVQLTAAADALLPAAMQAAVDATRAAADILIGWEPVDTIRELMTTRNGMITAMEHISRAGDRYAHFSTGDDRSLLPASQRLLAVTDMIREMQTEVNQIGAKLAGIAERMVPAVDEHLLKQADLRSAARELQSPS